MNQEFKFLGKFKKKIGGGSGGVGLGGQDGCERRIGFCENSKKHIFFFWGGVGRSGGGGRVGLGVQGGCERRIEVFVKIQKKNGGGEGVRGGRWEGSGWGSWWWGGQGGCERNVGGRG